jgi:hypothetical protein
MSGWFDFWNVVVLAILIGVVALVRRRWSATMAMALVFLLLLGALVPPLGVLLGALVFFYLVVVHGQELFGAVSGALGGSKS